MKELCEEYLLLKSQEKSIKERKVEIECKLYEMHQEKMDSKDEGTITVENDGFRLKVVKKEKVKIDQTMAEVVGLGFKKEYKLDKKAYKALSADDQKRVDGCLTTDIAKPSFSVESVEG